MAVAPSRALLPCLKHGPTAGGESYSHKLLATGMRKLSNYPRFMRSTFKARFISPGWQDATPVAP